MLPQKKYASIITILHNMENLSTMILGIVIGKIVVFEMSRKMGQDEASSSSKGKALTCSEKKKMKGKTSFEAWYGRKPSVSFLWTFSCVGLVDA